MPLKRARYFLSTLALIGSVFSGAGAAENKTDIVLPPNAIVIGEVMKKVDPECRSTDCLATMAILQMDHIVHRSWGARDAMYLPGPGGDAAWRRDVSGPNIRGQIRRMLWDRPELLGPICARLPRLAAHYYKHGPDAGDYDLVNAMVLTAEMIDWRQHTNCLQPVLQALPINHEVIEGVRWARDWCFHSQWRNLGCRRIVFPQPGAPDPDPLPDSTLDAKNPAK